MRLSFYESWGKCSFQALGCHFTVLHIQHSHYTVYIKNDLINPVCYLRTVGGYVDPIYVYDILGVQVYRLVFALRYTHLFVTCIYIRQT